MTRNATNIQVDEDCGELWLTWDEPAFGSFVALEQRRLTRWEALLWRILRRTPAP